jgi:hypothetical protein
MMEYAETFLGIPYRWWNPEVSCFDTTGPFWAGCTEEVSLETAKKGEMNCAGFLNLLCLKAGLPIPGAKEKHFYAGGTGMWWNFFEERGMMIPYEAGISYPVGSILLRKYRDEGDQGHIAIVHDERRIIHSWPEGGVILAEPDTTYYEMVVTGWLNKNLIHQTNGLA